MPASWRPWSGWVATALAVGFAIPAYVLPLLRWRTTTYTLTNHRLITRAGILNKVGHDVPVARISNVAYERSLSDRVFAVGRWSSPPRQRRPWCSPTFPRSKRSAWRSRTCCRGACVSAVSPAQPALRTQLVRFVITGGLSAVVDYGLLVALMAVGLGYAPAKGAVMFIAGTTTAYLINRRWTFVSDGSRRNSPR